MSRVLPEDLCKEAAGQPYRPSNGTEGDIFQSYFCDKCRKWPINPDAKTQCGIFLKMLIKNVGEKGYPKQIRYAPDGSGPECTSFRQRGMTRIEKAAALRKHLTP